MVVRVGNDDTVRVGNGNVVWMFELAFLLAATAKFTDEGAVRLEDLQFVAKIRGYLSCVHGLFLSCGRSLSLPEYDDFPYHKRR